ncbi:MAG TPA: folylpolyglutamate synthase/dihydrofolate synthase family protein [Ignavibacteria bacterium]|nr:folylpolyglutamate synthase/dihydrofolate synthase family protein [Ignavibacteria bacterium]HRA99386.1 folylpolyglutamate synthase/dihydrofolate synthase family protein [Ignavibacteria bacterium]
MNLDKFTSYNTALKYLFELERAGIKYDLSNIRKLLKILGNPHKNFKSVHIAGTNGKGSVSSIINSVLIEKGIRTGLYTSPHILDFRERILVNGKFISKKFILGFVNRMYDEIEKIKPSFYEVTTAMAFEYFSFMKMEISVIETGLGGRLDSTNIITPLISVITGISIDHIEYLGSSISSITREKGGIIKKKVPVVTGNLKPVSKKILSSIALEKNSPIYNSFKEKNYEIAERTETGFYFTLNKKKERYFFPVIGDYQIENICTAVNTLKILKDTYGIAVDSDILKKGFQNIKINSGYKGRFEIVSEKTSDSPKLITDISHNVQGIKNIENNLKYFKFDKAVIIFGMMNDKNYKDCILELKRLNHHVIFTKPEYSRSAKPEDLYNVIKGNKEKFDHRKNFKEAYELALSMTKKNDLILITGSFFLVSDFLRLLNTLK